MNNSIFKNWDIANDPDYSTLLDPPYNRFLVQGFGNVFEYDGEKQILICGPEDLEIVQNYDMEGEYEIEEIEAYCYHYCLLYTSPSPRDLSTSRMPSSA